MTGVQTCALPISMAQFCFNIGDCGGQYTLDGTLYNKGVISTAGKPAKSIYKNSATESLKLSLNVNNQIVLTGDEFSYPQAEVDSMIKNTNDYLREVTSWSVMDIYFGKIKLWFLHSSYCNVWKAPSQGNCKVCQIGDLPCTEYKCKSLGGNCVFDIKDGEPTCDALRTDNNPPVISFHSIEEGYTVNPSFFPGSEGVEVQEDLTAYDYVKIKLKTSKPTVCNIRVLPITDFSWSQLPWFSDNDGWFDMLIMVLFQDYNELLFVDNKELTIMHDMELKIPNVHFIREKLQALDAWGTVTKINNLDDLIDTSDEYIDKLTARSKKYGKDPAPILKNYNSMVTKIKLLKMFSLPMAKIRQQIFMLMAEVTSSPPRIFMFFQCTDANGKSNEKNFFVSAKIGEDRKPPKIIEASDDVKVAFPFEFEVKVNEPSDCRYSVDLDAAYGSMDVMDCYTYKPYSCKDVINLSQIGRAHV